MGNHCTSTRIPFCWSQNLFTFCIVNQTFSLAVFSFIFIIFHCINITTARLSTTVSGTPRPTKPHFQIDQVQSLWEPECKTALWFLWFYCAKHVSSLQQLIQCSYHRAKFWSIWKMFKNTKYEMYFYDSYLKISYLQSYSNLISDECPMPCHTVSDYCYIMPCNHATVLYIF